MAYKRWFIPVAILIILLGARLFRWETVSVKQETIGSRTYTVKWTKDRWTNADYIETLNLNTIIKNPPIEWQVTTNATRYWQYALLLDGVWLVLVLWEDMKKSRSLDITDI